MSSAQSQRIKASCEVIWGKADYDIDIETDDYMTYQAIVQKDLGTSYEPLTMTGLCNSKDLAWKELDRMLGLWARQKQSGQPMTKDQELEIFGGPNGQNKPILRQYFASWIK